MIVLNPNMTPRIISGFINVFPLMLHVRILLVHMSAAVSSDTLAIPNLQSLALPMVARMIMDAFQNHVTWVTMERKVMDVIKCQSMPHVWLVSLGCFLEKGYRHCKKYLSLNNNISRVKK